MQVDQKGKSPRKSAKSSKAGTGTKGPSVHTQRKRDNSDAAEELCRALRYSNEIGTTQILSAWIQDLEKSSTGIPTSKYRHYLSKENNFTAFLRNVIVCTEANYDHSNL